MGFDTNKNESRPQYTGSAFVVSVEPVAVELEDLHVLEGLPVNHHPNEGDLFMKSRIACCARVDVEQVEFLVVDDL